MIQTLLTVIRILCLSGVTELRALGVHPKGLNHNGYFDDPAALARAAESLDQQGAESVCVTLNRLNPDLLARRANRADVMRRGTGTSKLGGEVIRRLWLLLDIDPKRPSGISATDAEHQYALKKGQAIRDWLATQGIPCVRADSGNGCHLLIRIDLPNDAPSESLVTRFTEAVAFRFDDATATVDQGTADASRIVKLYGTMARKGSSTPDRPHRRSALLDVPPDLSPVDAAVMEAVAAQLPAASPRYVPPAGGQSFDVGQWLRDKQLQVVSEGPWRGGYKYILSPCPFDPAHTNGAAYVIRMQSGALVAGCHHTSCQGKGWRELRLLKESGSVHVVPPAAGTSKWPDPPGASAFHGLAGKIVDLIDPATEADRVALLVQLLCGFGNVIGRSAHWRVGDTLHYLNLFVVLVGPTSLGRKGMAWDHVKGFVTAADNEWARTRIRNGLSTGEGVIWALRDPLGNDLGEPDKRLLIVEKEFASPLKVMQREANTLSALLRSAWDDGSLATLAKNQPATATGAHLSVIGHISKDELTKLLKGSEVSNGFANRFIFVCSTRSKVLPNGGHIDASARAGLEKDLAAAVAFGTTAGLISRTAEAEQVWKALYAELTVEREGLAGMVTARAAAQVMRLASLFALLEQTTLVNPGHLEAAASLWRYSAASVEHIFGNAPARATADRIWQALKAEPNGLTGTEIRDLFNRHAPDVGKALQILQGSGLAERVDENTGGRPVERWFAT